MKMLNDILDGFYHRETEPPGWIKDHMEKLSLNPRYPVADWIGKKILVGKCLGDSWGQLHAGEDVWIKLPPKPWFGSNAHLFWVYINAPPEAGKTTLLRLMYDQLETVVLSFFFLDIKNEIPSSAASRKQTKREMRRVWASLQQNPHKIVTYFPAFRQDLKKQYSVQKLFALRWGDLTSEQISTFFMFPAMAMGIIDKIRKCQDINEVMQMISNEQSLSGKAQANIIHKLGSSSYFILDFERREGISGVNEVIQDLKAGRTVDFTWGHLSYSMNSMISSLFNLIMDAMTNVKFPKIPCIFADESHRLWESYGVRSQQYEHKTRLNATMNQINEYRGKFWFVLASQSFLNFTDVFFQVLQSFPFIITTVPNAQEDDKYWKQKLSNHARKVLLSLKDFKEKYKFALVYTKQDRVILFKPYKAVSSDRPKDKPKSAKLPRWKPKSFRMPKKGKKFKAWMHTCPTCKYSWESNSKEPKRCANRKECNSMGPFETVKNTGGDENAMD